MNGTPGNGLVVRTAWLADSNLWVWEIVDSSSGEVLENSWPAHWAGYDAREIAEHAGLARLSELSGTTARSPASAPPTGGEATPVIGSRQVGRSILILVPRSRVDLYQALKRSFADDAKAQVILDRRFRDRRSRKAQHDVERRQEDRRRRADIDAQLRAGRTVTVPILPRVVNFLDPDARAILLLCCSGHVVGCPKCQTTYRIGSIPRTDPALFACPLCGFDITPAVAAHTETCSYWVNRKGSRKPPTGIESPRPPATSATG